MYSCRGVNDVTPDDVILDDVNGSPSSPKEYMRIVCSQYSRIISNFDDTDIDRLYRDAWIFNETVVLKLFWVANSWGKNRGFSVWLLFQYFNGRPPESFHYDENWHEMTIRRKLGENERIEREGKKEDADSFALEWKARAGR